MSNETTPFLSLTDIQYAFNQKPVLKNINLSIAQHELCALIGPSGCGKTTLLRLISGLLRPLAGKIHLNQKLIADEKYALAPNQRPIGMVFQDYALFPHLNVFHNIAYGIKHLDEKAQRQLLDPLIEMGKIATLLQRYPHQLSGGEQQRVALIRSLASQPDLLLLDEPFSNLDSDHRSQLAREVAQLLRDQKATAILVTHDQQEAFAFADHIGVLIAGEMMQWDQPKNLYYYPENEYVARFIGEGCFLPLHYKNGANYCEFGEIDLSQPSKQLSKILIRPEDIQLTQKNGLDCTVKNKIFKGSSIIYELALPSNLRIQAQWQMQNDFEINARVQVQLKAITHIVF